MENLLPTANPILSTPFEFTKPKFDYPGQIGPLPYFHHQYKPPKDVLNFECCDIDFFQREQSQYKTFHELHNNSALIYQRFVIQTPKGQNFASPKYSGTHLFSKGPIHFDSNFECGNLYTVHKVANKKYNLILHNDTQTSGCTRWYFFSVRTPERMMLQLNIINLSKQASYLSVNPYIYTARTGWYRGGDNVQYYKNNYKKTQDTNYYTLSFSYLFEKEDITYFSLYPPYGITSLQQFLKPLSNLSFFKLKSITINSGNQCPVISMGDSSKPLIVILARQHPSEVISSYVAEGIIQYLVNESGQNLREQFYFKILPMMNPDGVIHGNSTTTLQGIDINQKWHKVNKLIPSAQHVKAILKKAENLHLVLDLHQTFNKYGISFVGKYDQDQPFIAAISQICQYVNLNQSKFGKSTKMEKTLPFALGNILKMSCLFQMRISNQDENGKDISIKNLQQIGINICQAIDLTTTPQLIKQFPKFHQQMDISDSESCHSFDENNQNQKKIIKKKMTTIITGNENNLSIATTTTTKKKFLPSKLKPLCDLTQYQTSNKKSTQSSQFKTRIRSFSTRAPEFYLKN
ncbi:unnamed protein product [Paramecium pentaurelia]|uniref:Peptidase M14 domain-containing protein n=1 Tax=Paramecium pentaurelia TaxID=43138 RepID=A0A8S1TCK8_9CILI|nr:unnamed protein product [Paramecium pentaurelia]